MILSASSIAELKSPSECGLRVWIDRNTDVIALEPSGHARYLREQGKAHEKRVLDELTAVCPSWVDMNGFDNPRATSETRDAVLEADSLIYQGSLKATMLISGKPITVEGYPDFMIPGANGWEIADAKLVKSVFETTAREGVRERPDASHILLQLRLYGWLFEQNFPGLEFELKIYTGSGATEVVEYLDGGDALGTLEEVYGLRNLPNEPHTNVALSKCRPCKFQKHCWTRAEAAKSVALVGGIKQTDAAALNAAGISSFEQLLKRLDAESLTRLLSPKKTRPEDPENQGRASKILENARSLSEGAPIRRLDATGTVVEVENAICDDDSYVMFDVENLPEAGAERKSVYIWGLQVFGAKGDRFRPAIADFEPGADERCWRRFLEISRDIMLDHPGIKFVHWSHHDKTCVATYVERYGDDAHGTAAKVVESLVDLMRVVDGAVALPIAGTSLKQVEKVAGFVRSTDVAKGDDSIAAYVRARETRDPAEQTRIIDDLVAYNREDLEATWAVHQWLIGEGVAEADDKHFALEALSACDAPSRP